MHLFKGKQREDFRTYVHDLTLAELKQLKRKQVETNRSTHLNDWYDVLTFQEVIDNLRSLMKESPRAINNDTRIGLFVELKGYLDHFTTTGLNLAQMTNDFLI